MYFGSIRFFKNLILLCVIILILTPTILAVRKHMGLMAAETQAARLEGEVEETRRQLGNLEQRMARLETELEEAWTKAEEYAEQAAEADARETPSAEAVLAADAPGYQALYPDFYAPQPLSDTWTETEKMIYLTFDDGPTGNTDIVLEILAEKDVKATFFVTGHTEEAARQRMRDIVEGGHTLGMHTFCHDYDILYASVEAFLGDMYQIFTLIREATGETPTVFRFAGGSLNCYNAGFQQELMAEMLRRGFVPYDWNVSAQDAVTDRLSADEVIANIFESAAGKKRGIVLMHDGAGQAATAWALAEVIDRFRAMGYEFDRIHPDTKPILFDYCA